MGNNQPLTAAKQGHSTLQLLKKIMLQYSYWVSFFVLLIVAWRANPSGFFKWNNISNLFVQSAIIGIIALGMSLVIFAGQIDISVGAQVAIISGIGIEVLQKTQSILIMLLFCCAFGLFIGMINGMLVTYGKMPAMIATLAMQSACRSIITQLGQGGPFGIDSGSEMYNRFRIIAAGAFKIGKFRIPYLMVIFIGMTILFQLLTTRTKLGKHIYAIGSNERAARLSGVKVRFVKVSVFAITGLTCGISAFLLASRLMSIQPTNAGVAFEMDAIGAVAIGGASMSGGRGKIIGTFLGVLMFRMISNIMVSANVPPFLNGLVSGVIIVLAVLMQNFQTER